MTDPWICPNVPRCPHPGVVHDIEDLEDQRPACCVEGCYWGHSDPDASRRLDIALIRQRVEQAMVRSLPAHQFFGPINPY